VDIRLNSSTEAPIWASTALALAAPEATPVMLVAISPEPAAALRRAA
jgi:hypothetical protein